MSAETQKAEEKGRRDAAMFIAGELCYYCEKPDRFTKAHPYDDEPTEFFHHLRTGTMEEGTENGCESPAVWLALAEMQESNPVPTEQY